MHNHQASGKVQLGFPITDGDMERAHAVARYAREHPYGKERGPTVDELGRHVFVYGPMQAILLHIRLDEGNIRAMSITCEPIAPDETRTVAMVMVGLVAVAKHLLGFSDDAAIGVDEDDPDILHVTESERPSPLN